MYNGQLVAELNGTGKPNATIYIRQFETMDGKVYVPVGNGTAGCYGARLTKNNMVFEIETTMQEQDDEVEQTAAALIDEANNDEAVKTEDSDITENDIVTEDDARESKEAVDKSVDVDADTDADAEEENVKETSETTEELETDDMQEESGVADIVKNM